MLHLAGAFGKPVIATDVGELGVTIGSHGLGLVVTPEDAAGFAHAIGRLATDAALRTRLGQTARAWAEGGNAPRTVGARMADLYGSILANGRRR